MGGRCRRSTSRPGPTNLVPKSCPAFCRKLRGEWPCVPFGYSVSAEGWPDDWAQVMGSPESDEEVHGHSSNHDWTWLESDGHSLSLALDYPVSSPVVRVERTVTPDPAAPAVDIEFSIPVRRACRLPIGLHPVFRLPSEAGAAELELGAFDHGRTYPDDVEPGVPLFAKDAVFAALTRVPARAGGAVDASRLPLAVETEELLQIEGLDGMVALANHAEGYRIRLSWQKEHFPSLLLWYSQPRPQGVAVERPAMSPSASSRSARLSGSARQPPLADNPIARSGIPTALAFVPERPFTTRYRIEAAPL